MTLTRALGTAASAIVIDTPAMRFTVAQSAGSIGLAACTTRGTHLTSMCLALQVCCRTMNCCRTM